MTTCIAVRERPESKVAASQPHARPQAVPGHRPDSPSLRRCSPVRYRDRRAATTALTASAERDDAARAGARLGTPAEHRDTGSASPIWKNPMTRRPGRETLRDRWRVRARTSASEATRRVLRHACPPTPQEPRDQPNAPLTAR
jgi:hypothetical protein